MLVLAKLVTKEFIIAQQINNTLTNPALVQFTANQMTGEVQIKLVPYMSPLNDNIGITISIDKCVYFERASENIVKLYLSFTQSMLSMNAEKPENTTETTDGQVGISGNEDTSTAK